MLVGDGILRGRARSAGMRPTLLVDHILIIRTLLLRLLRLKYMKRPAGFIMEFFRPTIICVLHYYTFTLIDKATAPGIAMEEFVWGGFVVWFVFSHICVGLGHHLPSRFPFPGVSAMHLRLAMATWSLLSNMAFLYISVIIMIIFGDDVRFPSILVTTFVLLTAATMAFGWGILAEALCRAAPILEPIFHFLPWLVFLTSGVYFSFESVPLEMAEIDIYNPLLHLIEYERSAFDPGYPVKLLSLSYPAF